MVRVIGTETRSTSGATGMLGRMTIHTNVPSRALGLAIALLLALLTSFGAAAQRVEGDRARAEGIYATEVQVNGQGEGERNSAFARGLASVLGKLSGDR